MQLPSQASRSDTQQKKRASTPKSCSPDTATLQFRANTNLGSA